MIDWTAPTPDSAAGLRFDTLVKQGSVLPAWTVWGGNAADSPTWAIRLSTHAPTALIQDITFELAHGHGHRQPRHSAAAVPHMTTLAAPARPSASAPRPAPRR